MNTDRLRLHGVRGVVGAFILLVACSSGARAQLPQLLYLPLNEGAGTATADLAAPGIPGSAPLLSNGSNWDVVNPFFGAAAWNPSPTNSEVVSTGIVHSHTTDFTIEFAIYPDPDALAPPNRMAIIALGGAVGFFLERNVHGDYGLFMFGGSSFQRVVSPAIPLREWTFISVAYHKSVFLMGTYLNGELVFVSPLNPFSILASAPWTVGFSFNGPPGRWRGKIDEVRVWDTARSAAFVRLGAVGEPATIDVGAGNITSPPRTLAHCQYYSSNEVITVEVCNPGLTIVPSGSTIPMDMEVDGILVASDALVLNADLNPGDSVAYTFSAPADLSAPTRHVIRITSSYPGDTQPLNDVIELDFKGGGPGVVSTFPWTESFDAVSQVSQTATTPPIGWINVQNEPAGNGTEQEWEFESFPQPAFPGPYPAVDHTSGSGLTEYATSGPGFATETLESPCIDLIGVSQPSLSFYVNTYSPPGSLGGGILTISVVSLTTGITSFVGNAIFNVGPDEWRLQEIDLTPFVGEIIVIRFQSAGGSASDSLSIDDVSITDQAILLKGQAPQQGIATLDISFATNGHKKEIMSGENGPFEKVSRFPAILDFVFEGIPSQPFILLSGLRNEVNATYPSIGQMDVGGPLDLASGFPTALTVWGNGFALATAVDFLFYTDSAGTALIQAQLPQLPIAPFDRNTPFATFQCVMGVPAPPFFAVSNAVQLLNW